MIEEYGSIFAQVQRINEFLKQVELQKEDLNNIIKEINNLDDSEKLVIRIQERLFGLFNRANLLEAWSQQDRWIRDLLQYCKDKKSKTINELKNETIWENPTYKTHKEIADSLLQVINIEQALKVVDIIIPKIKMVGQ